VANGRKAEQFDLCYDCIGTLKRACGQVDGKRAKCERRFHCRGRAALAETQVPVAGSHHRGGRDAQAERWGVLPMYKHVLIATDGSVHSGKGVESGLGVAKALGAKVTVLTVSEPYPVYDLGSKMGLFKDHKAIESYTSQCKHVADKVLSDAADAASAAGVDCETLHVENSAPADAILETAKSRSCDLIVLASHGRRCVERLLLGSQASRVVQSAETSVLVVR
jgi:nucleotide-binding universal stress UspA family protein